MLLDYASTQELVKKYRLPYARELFLTSAGQVRARAHELKFPLVLKAVTSDTHKTDKGLVRTNIHDIFDLKRELTKLERILQKDATKPKGFLIQEQVKGVEFIIGAKADASFGKVIVFGFGGIFVELIRQRSVRVLPVSRQQLREMVHETPAQKFFTGYRGLRVSEEKLLDVFEKAASLATREKIEELDFNPVIANEEAAIVVDARIAVPGKQNSKQDSKSKRKPGKG